MTASERAAKVAEITARPRLSLKGRELIADTAEALMASGDREDRIMSEALTLLLREHVNAPEDRAALLAIVAELEVDVIAQTNAKDAAYQERNNLVALLARIYPAGVHRQDIAGWDPEWLNCVYIDLPTGQMSWHYHDTEAHLFAGLPPYAGKWDGHTTDEKYERLRKMMEQLS